MPSGAWFVLRADVVVKLGRDNVQDIVAFQMEGGGHSCAGAAELDWGFVVAVAVFGIHRSVVFVFELGLFCAPQFEPGTGGFRDSVIDATALVKWLIGGIDNDIASKLRDIALSELYRAIEANGRVGVISFGNDT